MHENRTSYPKRKTQMYQQLQELPKKYKVLAVIKLHKVRSTQILPLRKILKGDVEFVAIKDKVAQKALDSLDIPGIKEMGKDLEGQCMFLFTNMSPFKLNVLLAKNKVMMAARGGDIASIDIIVPAKNTGIAPGPMLTEFKEAGIPTKIDQGTIWVSKDSIVAKPGDVISTKLASLLSKMNIKPIEAGIVVNYALADKLIFTENDLRIDLNELKTDLSRSYNESIALAVESSYFTKESIGHLLSKASGHAQSLSIESNYMTKETAGQIISISVLKANNVASQLKSKGYSPS